MTTITTTAAATQAGVTVATIHTWCRHNVIAAAKVAGRWVIDTASLAHRIAIGAMRTTKQAPSYRLGHSLTTGQYTVTGPSSILAAAFEAGTTITLTGDYEGDRVYLGYTGITYGNWGRGLKTHGLEATLDNGQAVYLIDSNRLDDAPKTQALLYIEEEQAMRAEARMAAFDSGYLNPDYE